MIKDKLVSPVVKWVGGKRQILDDIKNIYPEIFLPIMSHL